MSNEETIKLEYTKELYNRTLKREKELNEEVEKIFEEIKIDIHNLIAEKLALINTKEILFEEIQKQARQEGLFEGAKKERERILTLLEEEEKLFRLTKNKTLVGRYAWLIDKLKECEKSK